MPSLTHLLRPKWAVLKRPSKGSSARSPGALLFFLGLGLLFWWGIFKGAQWLCLRCLQVEDIGALLLQKILSMAFLTFFAILLFSNLVTAFSTFFLSDDLQLLNSAPIPRHKLFAARFLETLFHASWMIVVFGFPFLLAYGQAFQAEPWFYVQILVVFLPFVVIPCAVAVLVSFVLASWFPVHRTRELLLFLGILGFVVLLLYFRALEPERFLNPDRFSEAIEFLGMLRDPTSPFLPSDWAVSSLFPSLQPKRFASDPIHLLSLYSTAASFAILAYWFFEWLYPLAFSRAQEGKKVGAKQNRRLEALMNWMFRPFSRPISAMLRKELLIFLRNPGQWAQLLLLGALIVVYVLNFKALRSMSGIKGYGVPAVIVEMGIYVFNLILLGFVISAVSVRFAFPAVSLEGRCFWLIRQSPLPMRKFLQSKFWSVFLPLTLFAELMAVVTNFFIQASFVQMAIAAFLVLLMTVGITGMGVGLGAVYPRFDMENPAKIATGFGGVVYMISSMIWVASLIGFGLLPLRYVIMARLTGTPVSQQQLWIMVGIALFSVVCAALAYILPMRMGRKSLERIGAL